MTLNSITVSINRHFILFYPSYKFSQYTFMHSYMVQWLVDWQLAKTQINVNFPTTMQFFLIGWNLPIWDSVPRCLVMGPFKNEVTRVGAGGGGVRGGLLWLVFGQWGISWTLVSTPVGVSVQALAWLRACRLNKAWFSHSYICLFWFRMPLREDEICGKNTMVLIY